MFRLPELTTEVDCEPIGYPGLVVTFVLNLGYEAHAWPWEADEEADHEARALARREILAERPWESEFYYGLGRMLKQVTFPGQMTESGAAEVVALPDGQAVYELMHMPGFEQNIIVWASARYNVEKQERLKAELGN